LAGLAAFVAVFFATGFFEAAFATVFFFEGVVLALAMRSSGGL